MARWADYSQGYPGAPTLKAAGFVGVIRYVGLGSAGKRITAAEYRDLVAHGLRVLLVAELGTTDAWGGYGAGVANAKLALADARKLGIPDSVGIAAAADSHATTQGEIDAAVQYARGFQDVLGQPRTGFYGFSETVNAVRAAGIGSWYWRCGSQPTGADAASTHLWQRNTAPTTTVVAGISCDINDQLNPLPEDDMALSDNVGTAPDGHAYDVQDVLGNIYLGMYYPSGDFMKATALGGMIASIQTSVAALPGALAQEEADLLAAIKNVSAGQVDVDTLAAQLSTKLGPDLAKALGEKLVAA